MKLATIISSTLLILWVILTLIVVWTNALSQTLYIKLSFTMGIIAIVSIVIALALREYATDKKLKDDNYID